MKIATISRPIVPVGLADELADNIAAMIRSKVYEPGDRLPSILEMARSSGVGHPTVREASKNERLSALNMSFHYEIAVASGNSVLAQLLKALTTLFQEEQRQILGIYGSRERDHQEHVQILVALLEREGGRAVERMRLHLEGVRDVLRQWDPEATPLD